MIPAYREHKFERRSEYQGTIVEGNQEIDICTHRHRSARQALRCAKRMIQLRKKNENS
jgi:hypothetical protein